MGNSQGLSSSPEFASACRRFSQSELQDLKKLFISLAAQSRSHGQFISASVFQAYFGIHGSLGSRLFDLISGRRKGHCIFFEDLVVAKAFYEKGSPDEVEIFLYQLADLLGDGCVQRSELEAVVLSTLETVLGPKDAIPGAALPESSIQAFVKAAEFSVKADGEEGMSEEDFRRWCYLVPSFKRFLRGLMAVPGAVVAEQLGRCAPELLVPGNVNPVLRKEFAWHISGVLQQQEARQWTLLYHSSLHGRSFTTFFNKFASAVGPSVVLIKDREENIFGGYASQPWERHHEFYGDMKSFLFTILPQSAIYRASGANSNLQWCAVNYTSDSIPNGIGFGGQINHYGIFIPATFDRGYTLSSVTYNNPLLSSKREFLIDVIECWGVLPSSKDDAKGMPTPEGTILQRYKEDRHMLNMVGIANSSNSVG